MILIYHLYFNVRMQLECIHKLCSAKVLKRLQMRMSLLECNVRVAARPGNCHVDGKYKSGITTNPWHYYL